MKNIIEVTLDAAEHGDELACFVAELVRFDRVSGAFDYEGPRGRQTACGRDTIEFAGPYEVTVAFPGAATSIPVTGKGSKLVTGCLAWEGAFKLTLREAKQLDRRYVAIYDVEETEL